jgi:hypothetical protein
MFRFVFKTIILFKLLALAFAAGMGTAYALQVRRQYDKWGLAGDAAERELAGDELVEAPDLVETRHIDIDVARDEVWPWLAQLGYGRGGWYALPALDRPWCPAGGPVSHSADTILPEFGDLAVGDLVPTHPQGGFEARVVEPGKTLVLYLDDKMTREQIEELVADRAAEMDEDAEVMLQMPPYRVTWAFVLEDLPGGRTRLIERLRASVEASENQKRARPIMRMALFAFLRSQLEGIKYRAEGTIGPRDEEALAA